MEDIAGAAGVTKPLLYQHFSSKRALFLELLEEVARQLVNEVTTATATAPGPRQQVEAGFAAYFGFALRNESAFRLLFDRSVPHDPELDNVLRKVEDTIAEAISPLIDADIDAEHQRLLASAVVGMAEGASRYWLREAAGTSRAGDGAIRRLEPATADAERAANAARLARRMAEFAWGGLRSVRRDE